MEVLEIKWIVHCLRIVAAAGTFGLLLTIALTKSPGQMLLQTYEEIDRSLKKSHNSLLDYGKLQDYLQRSGAEFHFGSWISPISFVALRLILGGTGMLLGSRYQLGAGVILAVICYWIPDVLLNRLNGRDNERMLPEIKLVYNAIAMQIKAGVYVTDALAECYGSVQGRRLREALMTLSSDIAMNADIEDALEKFQGKFENQYIDALCITILQALESGQAVELLNDIAEQLKDMEVSLMNKKKSSLDRSITFYQLGILAAVLTVVLYACVSHMMSAALSF